MAGTDGLADTPQVPGGAAGTGLTSGEARARLAERGPNVLPEAPAPQWWRQLIAQLTHFFALMLWAAGALAFVAGTPQLGIAICLVVVVNGLFSFVQEHRAEQASARLHDLLPRSATVVRDGDSVAVDPRELVVGDLVVLEAGDKVSADLRITEGHSLAIDTSTMTGESVPSRPDAGEMALAGTFVAEGEGRGVVTATGVGTRLAAIALLTRARHRPPSPLALELHRVVTVIARVAIGVGVAFYVVSMVLGMAPANGFILAVGVTVALVPEGLLPTVTLALAVGAQRMAARNALVRRLESVETLGSTTFICTDKTGTLTQNQMVVVEVWTPAGRTYLDGAGYAPDALVTGPPAAIAQARKAAVVARRCSSGRAVERDGHWTAQGDPMEAAIDALDHRLSDRGTGPDKGAPDLDDARRFPFDPRRRRMSVLTGTHLFMKGAPESVLPLCGADRRIHDVLEAMAEKGLRVLAVAVRPHRPGDEADTVDRVETGLEVVALLGFEDPPRPEVHDAIAKCRGAGIKVAMITGDHPATAAAIARETGLSIPGSPVLEEHDLPEGEDELALLLDRDGIVLARVQPETKLRVARALQSRGHIVAMTGDGVNDGPALQQADIGIAMGASGTDVARAASDLVLLDDNFATIVHAIEHGRATFANIRRFLTYHLTDNVAELTPFLVFALSAGRIPLAIAVMQILFLDIGTDLLPALALGAEPPSAGLLDTPPQQGHLIDGTVLRRAFIVLGPFEAFAEMAVFFAAFLLAGWRPGDPIPDGAVLLGASGAAFATVVVAQAANAFACRSSTRSAWRIAPGTNLLLPAAVAVELVTLVGFLAIPPVARILGQAMPPLSQWPLILAAAPALLLVDAMDKAIRRRRSR